MSSNLVARFRCLICLSVIFGIGLGSLFGDSLDNDYTGKINGTQRHFRVRGRDSSSPYLLILHGGPGFSAHMFYPWGKSVEALVNVVYLDQRGCGQSTRLVLKNPMQPEPGEVRDYTMDNLLKTASSDA